MIRTGNIFSALIFRIFFLITVILLNACNKDDSDIKLAFLYTSKVTDRYNKESQFFKQKAEELGAKVFVAEGNNNDAVQYKKALEFIDKDIDVLCLIAVNTNTAAAIVRAAKEKDVKVIAYDRMVKSEDIDLFISGNNKKLGENMCNAVLEREPEGNYIILNGDKFDRNAVELQQSIDSVLKPYVKDGRVNIMYETFVEDWNGDNAAYELEQVISLTGKVPDVIIAAYDGIADGAIKVLDKYGYAGKVLITGQDAELRAIKHIVKGEQLMTVYHPLKKLASRTALIAFNMAKGKNPDQSEITYTNNGLANIPTIKNNSIPVFKENIDELLINSGVYSKEEVYN